MKSKFFYVNVHVYAVNVKIAVMSNTSLYFFQMCSSFIFLSLKFYVGYISFTRLHGLHAD